MTTRVIPPRVPKRKDLPTVHRGRVTITRKRETFLRTELLARPVAEILYAAMRKSPQFVNVEMVRDHHRTATDLRHYVRFQETEIGQEWSAEVRQVLTARLERAMHQYKEMWQPEADEEGWFWTLHQHPHCDITTVYSTHPGSGDGEGFDCTCPDMFRPLVQATGCKHVHRLRAALALPALLPKRRGQQSQFDDTPEGKAERLAWAKANAGRDF